MSVVADAGNTVMVSSDMTDTIEDMEGKVSIHNGSHLKNYALRTSLVVFVLKEQKGKNHR